MELFGKDDEEDGFWREMDQADHEVCNNGTLPFQAERSSYGGNHPGKRFKTR